MDCSPMAAGVGMFAGEEQSRLHGEREFIRRMNRSSRNVGLGAQAVGVVLPVVMVLVQQAPACIGAQDL